MLLVSAIGVLGLGAVLAWRENMLTALALCAFGLGAAYYLLLVS
jgi:hypothetical protein